MFQFRIIKYNHHIVGDTDRSYFFIFFAIRLLEMSENDRLITEARGIQHTRIAVEDVGRAVRVRNTMYAYSNHFITQSRPYFRRQLPTYIDCVCFLWLTWAMFWASWLGALADKGGYYKGAPFYCFFVCAIFIGIFCQHEIVNRKSLRIVLTQPVLDGQQKLNALYEVTVTELQGMALQNYQAGIGFVHVSEGKVKFQAFNRKAEQAMICARKTSRCMLILFLGSACFNFYFMMTSSLGLAFSREWSEYGKFSTFKMIFWYTNHFVTLETL